MSGLEFIHDSAFYELTALLVMAAIAGFIGRMLHQPLIVGFIAVGILAGPSVLGVVQSREQITLLAELGIAVLLFLIGLKLDFKLIKTLGSVSLATGIGQVLFTSVIGFLIALALGMNAITSLYVAVALTFSSTIIIVKLLSDKKEADALHGRIAIGFLIVQDIVVVVAMMVLSGMGIGTQSPTGASVTSQVSFMLMTGIAIATFMAVFMRYLATPLTARMAHSPELLVTFAISWAALFAAAGSQLGFSKELGGLLAGVSLASTPFREAIVSRLSSLRDFLLLFFFIALGSQLNIGMLGDQLFPALVLSLFVLIGNPLIVMAIMGVLGYRKRTGFLAGLTVAQISEFSLIFIAMGVEIGHISLEALSLTTLVGLITISLSVYMITYSHELYRMLERWLGIFERGSPVRERSEDAAIQGHQYDVILLGMGRYGSSIAEELVRLGKKLLVVDFNPDEVRNWRDMGYSIIYGDACDQDFIVTLPLQHAGWVVSALPKLDTGITHQDPRLILVDSLKSAGFAGKIALATHQQDEAALLLESGASLVLLPFRDAAVRAVEKIASDGYTREQY